MSSFPTIQICGGFNSWVLGSNVFTYYNNSHDSLETLVYVTNDQRFKFALLNDDSTYTYLGPDDSISFTHTDIDIGDYYEEDGSHNFWFNGDTGYYLFGACVVNTNPSGTPSRAIYYYMSALSTDTSAGTYLLAQKIQEVLTCEATSDQASELAILYGLCADYTDRDTYLLAYTFSDYSLEDYAANDYSYVGLEDMNHTTNAYAKYQWIQYIANGGDMPDPGAIRLFGNGFDYEDDMTSMVIIIASSVSLLSLTALSVLIIKKKKTTSK